MLLEFLSAEDAQAAPLTHLREPVRLSPHLPIDAALRQLRRARQPMGIVVNPRGDAIGLVTVKDLVEEIVGELKTW